MEDINIYREKMNAIIECIENYSSPIYIVGNIEQFFHGSGTTILSATVPKEELLIRNRKYPNWFQSIIDNSLKNNNLLLIKDFDQISIEEQKLFLDIICEHYFSSEQLPENLKIIINSMYDCPILPDIREVIQYFKI